MKITKICLEGFRAFDEPFDLDLGEGKNLLLHGENGSGKSSIYLAMKRFFEEQGDDVEKHRNHFSPANRKPYVHVHIKGDDTSGNHLDVEFQWDVIDGHPLPVPKDPNTAPINEEMRSLLVEGARRAGFLDYRGLLKTHLLSSPLPRIKSDSKIHKIIYGAPADGFEAQLFDLVSFVILAGVRVTIPGGSVSTIGTLIRKVWENRPSNRRQNELRRANDHANIFNQAFNSKLQELENKLKEFLDFFDNHQLTIKFQPISLSWDKKSLNLKGAELIPQITFRGKAVTEHHQFLNESRLSAIATCLFLSGVFLSDNDYVNPAHLRFLVLDDALIGLELQNRLPILRILTSDTFKNYQIFLLTYDRVWFDLARGHLPEKNGWIHKELLADESSGKLIPKWRPCKSDIETAKAHLDNGDLKAAAVYARSAFECYLNNVCVKNGIKIPFKDDLNKVGAGMLWDGIIERQRDREVKISKGAQLKQFVPKQLLEAVDIMKSTVLNKLSHSGACSLVRSEVEFAIKTVEKVIAHEFPGTKK